MLGNRCVRGAVASGASLALAACATIQPLITPGPIQAAASRHASSGHLIFAAAADASQLYVFSYPDGKVVRKFAPPNRAIALGGLCTDSAGHLFVTSLSKAKGGAMEGHLTEYKDARRLVVQTLSIPTARPFGCSIDPKTGTIAVSSVGLGSRRGRLETFSGGNRAGYSYYGDEIQNYYYCAYDDRGNLFVNGQGKGTQMYLSELAHGKTQLTDITLDRYVSVSGMGQLQWDGSHLTLEDFTAGAIYQISVSGSQATVVGKSPLLGWNGTGLAAILGSSVIAPNGVSQAGIGFWKYPTGGQAKRSVSSPAGLFGLTIGVAPSP